LLAILGLSANAQSLKWTKNWNSSGTQMDLGSAVITDASGNVYVTGGANYPQYSDRSIETIKYNASGVQQWATNVNTISTSGDCDFEYGYTIALDDHGNVWVAAVAYSSSANEYDDLTLIKYSSNGGVRPHYPKHYADLDNCSGVPIGCCLAVYDSTHVYIGGSTYDNASNTWALIVLKDSTTTTWGWKNIPYTKSGTLHTSSYEHRATDLKANANNVWVTGWIQNTNHGKDCWTAELKATNGSQVWGTSYNGPDSLDDVSNAMYVDGSGNVYIDGYTTTASNGKDGLIIKYNNNGIQQWAKTYNYNNLDEVYTCIAYGTKCSTSETMVYAGGYVEKTATDYDYLLTAYSISSGNLSPCWSTNPVFYDGAAGAPEAAGTDQGYAISFEPTTSRVYISGRSDELVGSTKTIKITTEGYDATSGSNVWSASEDYGSDVIKGDQMSCKYGLVTKYNSGYCVDEIYVEGNSYTASTGYDYITIKYGCSSCIPCENPIGGRLANPDEEVQTGLYPNPFSSEAVLSISPSIQINNAVLFVYDIAGRLVSSINNITKNEIIINRGNLKNGLYFYKLTDNGNIIGNGKFIIAEE
jgi:Secretion system C-terminal sorting domain